MEAAMISIPLSIAGSPEVFASAVQAFIEASTAHMMGQPGQAAPRASEAVESVVQRVPQNGPVASRGPDRFVALPYEIVDDTQREPEVQAAIDLLRETVNG
jgi:hypothetical protein